MTYSRFVFLSLVLVAAAGTILSICFAFAVAKHDESEFLLRHRTSIADLVEGNLRDPLLTGSMLEAEARVHKLSANGALACMDLESSSMSFSSCAHEYVKSQSVAVNRTLRFSADSSVPLAKLTLYFNDHLSAAEYWKRFVMTLATSAVFMSLVGFILFRAHKIFAQDLMRLVASSTEHSSAAGGEEKQFRFSEFNSVHRQLMRLVELEKSASKAAALSELASQVSHDIRSPLAALGMIVRDLGELPEEKRVLVRSAITRIKDISNSLLSQHKAEIQPATPSPVKIEKSAVLLSGVLESILTEKRLQYRSKLGIEIDSAFDRSSYGLFAEIQLIEFKRIISNLVNNAVEALGEQGQVTVGLSVDGDGKISVTVGDNGPGIPPEVLSRLGQRGASFGKEGTESGSGLGLYHARSTVERWGGRFAIESVMGHGTTMRIKLNRAQPPNWFKPELRFAPQQHVVVVDDDNSIHQIWDERFEGASLKEAGIQVHHFSTPDQLRSFVSNHRDLRATFLCDFELLGFSENGIDLIEQLNLAGDAVLVTSRFEEKSVLDRCLRARVPMIPKGMASIVPIRIEVSPVSGAHSVD